jgi:hypothetical protein
MSKAYLFYENRLLEEIGPEKLLTNRRTPMIVANSQLSRYIKDKHGVDVYNHGRVYAPYRSANPYEWWSCDMIPLHLPHIPKELRTLVLLLT